MTLQRLDLPYSTIPEPHLPGDDQQGKVSLKCEVEGNAGEHLGQIEDLHPHWETTSTDPHACDTHTTFLTSARKGRVTVSVSLSPST